MKLIQPKDVVRYVRNNNKDKVIGHTFEYYHCSDNEYVLDGVIYKKGFDKRNFESYECYCPVCRSYFEGSDYLKTIFEDEKILWLSNMVTHMRHTNHKEAKVGGQSSYDKTWGRGGYGWNTLASQTHDTVKNEQNEVEKRRLVKDKRFLEFLKNNEFKKEDIEKLQNTTEETISVWNKYFG